MDTSSILHTPALQDKSTKRTREEGSCSSIDTTHDIFEIMYRKKPKLNPVNEQEEKEEIVGTIETLKIIDRDTVVRENTTPLFQRKLINLPPLIPKVFRNSLALRSHHQENQWIRKNT